jgi:vancomycin resistance protein YoaR
MPTAPRRFPFGRLIFAVIAGFVLALAAGTGALFAYQGRYADRIYPGVTIAGVDVGGLDRAGARAAVEHGLAGLATGTIVVTASESTVRIPYAAVGRRADVDRLVDEAFAVGRTGDTVVRAADGVGSLVRGAAVAPSVVLDQAALTAAVAGAAAQVDAAPVDASAAATPTGFKTVASVAGRGIDRTALEAAIAAALADPAGPAEVAVTATLVPIEPTITDAEVADAVAAAGRMAADVVLAQGKESWTIPANKVRSWITFAPTTDGGYAATVAPDAPIATIVALAKKVNRAPVEASFFFGKNSAVVGVSAGANGRSLDAAATTPLVVRAILARSAVDAPATPPSVALAFTTTTPKLTTEQAQTAAPLMRKISSWTTYYEVSERNGFGNNISIPARDINGTVVAPGAVFDFWQSIGPVTYARGYRDGGAIIKGHSQPTGALGGGICSTSTTLFNAVVRAGYQTLVKKNHYYYITRYPVGLDATVVISGTSVQTMSWRNDSKYPVLIRSSASPGVVTFALYTVAVNNAGAVGGGTRIPGSTNLSYRVANGRTVKFRTSPKFNYRPASSSVSYTSSLSPGAVKVVEYADDGFDVSVTRTVSENGGVIHSDTWVSHYAQVNGLKLIGQ